MNVVKYFETVCYCPSCRKKGIKIYTWSNGAEELCPICNPFTSKQKKRNKCSFYIKTENRELILRLLKMKPMDRFELEVYLPEMSRLDIGRSILHLERTRKIFVNDNDKYQVS